MYHGDPLNVEGVQVYNDFGLDMIEMADKYGFQSYLMKFNCEDANYTCGHMMMSRKIN